MRITPFTFTATRRPAPPSETEELLQEYDRLIDRAREGQKKAREAKQRIREMAEQAKGRPYTG